MNKQRRKEIHIIKENIGYLIDKIKTTKKMLENISINEQDYLDNIPENLQSSMRADDSQDAIDNMEEAINNMDEAIDILNEANENLEYIF